VTDTSAMNLNGIATDSLKEVLNSIQSALGLNTDDIVLMLNGRALTIGPDDLVPGPGGGAELRRVLSIADGLRHGINVAECAVAQPPPAVVTRRVVLFGWHLPRAVDPIRRGGPVA
jgi:hypothetical protein